MLTLFAWTKSRMRNKPGRIVSCTLLLLCFSDLQLQFFMPLNNGLLFSSILQATSYALVLILQYPDALLELCNLGLKHGFLAFGHLPLLFTRRDLLSQAVFEFFTLLHKGVADQIKVFDFELEADLLFCHLVEPSLNQRLSLILTH